MKCAFFEEHSSSCVVYFRFSGTLFPVSMIDGDLSIWKSAETHTRCSKSSSTDVLHLGRAPWYRRPC